MINKTSKSGSETTISNSSATDRLCNIRTTDDQTPKSAVSLRANPGRAIFLHIKNYSSFCNVLLILSLGFVLRLVYICRVYNF